MIQAVIFDMDGLLVDSEPLWRQAERAAFQTVGIKPTDNDFQQSMGRGIGNVVEYWYHRQPWQGPSQADITALIVDDFLTLVKKKGRAKPGARQVLKFCRSHSLPMAIASSSSHQIIDAIVDKLEIRDFFDHLYSATQEPHSKPHPGVFISAAKLLGVRPEDCLVFEDAPSGVLAAKAARMHCIAVPESEVKDHKFIQAADRVIDSLQEFDEAMLTSL